MSDPAKSGKPDPSGKPAAAAPDTGKTLSELRAEYEASLASQSASDKGKPNELEVMRKEISDLRAAEADRSYRKAMDDTIVPAVLGELKVDADLVEMWVNKQAQNDPVLMALWNDRAAKPKEFKEAIAALAPEFKKYAESKGLVKPEGKTADDKGKLQSAVRSARDTTSSKRDMSTVDLSGMNDQQFALHSQEVFRLARAGQLT